MNRLVLEPTVDPSNGILGWNTEIEFIGHDVHVHQYQTDELKSFFVQNRNIRKFAADADHIVSPMDQWIFEANLELDYLTIKEISAANDLLLPSAMLEVFDDDIFDLTTINYVGDVY